MHVCAGIRHPTHKYFSTPTTYCLKDLCQNVLQMERLSYFDASNYWSRSHLDNLSKIVVRKYDLRIIPLVFLAYTIFWLDRSNIALARVNGLEQDLGLLNSQFNAGTFLPALMVAWGTATLCSGFVTNFAGLCASRAAVGAAEAGFLGGVLLWLGFFYTNDEIVSRIGILLSSMPLSGSLGGLLAGGLSRIQAGSYSRWPWIFFIEGALTVVVGIIAYFVMPDTPATASFLTGEEKIAAKARMILLDHRSFARRIAFVPSNSSSNSDIPKSRRNSTHPEAARNETVTTIRFSTTLDIPATIIGASSTDRIHKSTWRRAVLHPITLFMTVGCFFTVESIYAYNLFVPTLLVEMGFTGVRNPLMTVPPTSSPSYTPSA
uniref:Major facilitator superfamily (MFS) profile domain-containing protein n=1 Tax=Bionectria ochroleuca TaxID=29856 RepID=A0A8H7KFV5_BIOOC